MSTALLVVEMEYAREVNPSLIAVTNSNRSGPSEPAPDLGKYVSIWEGQNMFTN